MPSAQLWCTGSRSLVAQSANLWCLSALPARPALGKEELVKESRRLRDRLLGRAMVLCAWSASVGLLVGGSARVAEAAPALAGDTLRARGDTLRAAGDTVRAVGDTVGDTLRAPA